MHCTHCGMPKGTSQVEGTSNNEKSKLVASSYACLKASVSQAVSKKIPLNKLFLVTFRQSESLFGLSFT